MSSSHLRRELAGIALMLFGVFLAGALAVLALAALRSGVDVRGSVGWVGWYLAPPRKLVGWRPRRCAPRGGGPGTSPFRAARPGGERPRPQGPAWWCSSRARVAAPRRGRTRTRIAHRSDYNPRAGLWGGLVAAYCANGSADGRLGRRDAGASALTAATLAWNPSAPSIGRPRNTRLPLAADRVEPAPPPRAAASLPTPRPTRPHAR